VSTVPTPAPVGASAALDAAQDAVQHTRRHLFPFDLRRWLTLGFVAFLDQCGRGGFGMQLPGGGTGGGDGSGTGNIEKGLAWLAANVVLVSVIVAFLLAFAVAFIALVLWINSRGVFMYLDNVATGRAEVARPWRAHAGHAASYFAWSFALTMATLIVVMLFVAGIAAAVLFMVHGGRGAAAAGIAVIVGLAFAMVGVLLVAVLTSVALRDFVAPLQMATGGSCGAALRLFGALLRARPGLFALYVLLKLGFVIAFGIVAAVVGCCTCCCGFLPVVSQTILQPGHYFERAWSLHLLRRLGFAVMVPPPAATPASLPPM
jgi:hypothetical protein